MSRSIEYLVLKPVVIEYQGKVAFKHDNGSVFLSYENKKEAEISSENGKYPIYELEVGNKSKEDKII